MYGSYGSYSATFATMDVDPGYLSTHSYDFSCAFPSWPRRSSLSEPSTEYMATSFLSNEDLFPQHIFEDYAQSITNSSSTVEPQITEADLMEMQQERMAVQRRVVRFHVSKGRRQAAKRRGSSGSKKSPTCNH